MPTFLIADDHPLYREALALVVRRGFPDATCHEVSTLPDALEALEREKFDLVMLDLLLPGVDGFAGLVALRNRAPDVPVLMVSASERTEAVRQALLMGAAGYLPKSSTGGITENAIRLVLSGGCYLPPQAMGAVVQVPSPEGDPAKPLPRAESLTRRQMMVLEKLAEGLSNKEIARELEITEITVKAHVTAVLRKFGVSTRAQAIVAANRMVAAGAFAPAPDTFEQ
ncbi:response regulator [Novispirillum sp. DQ9]|uniref:response regulator n=1 Tax=Novispirillum sp. DQ9 TaxID=3398612 RepID=UPI003C7A9B04